MSTHQESKPGVQERSAQKNHEDELLDEALAGSFPASDPPSTLVADEPVKGKSKTPADNQAVRTTNGTPQGR